MLSNRCIEMAIIPSIGRIMQVSFRDGTEGPFWENPGLSGQPASPDSRQWANFGGDKVWPAPQSTWPAIFGRGWPPPATFDSLPLKGEFDGRVLSLQSEVDPSSGMRLTRRIIIDPLEARFEVENTLSKVEGQAITAAVWVVTQLKSPLRMYIPHDSASGRCEKQYPELPPDFRQENGLVSFSRDRLQDHKVGSNAESLLWTGETQTLRMGQKRIPGAAYPDNDSSVEIFTCAEMDYVELEMLGPLVILKPGDASSLKVTYTLERTRTSL